MRQVREGELYTLNYGLCASIAADPIEKKPLYHFYPGRKILSIGTWGCNFRCRFCQNWTLAHGDIAGDGDAYFLKPADILDYLSGDYKDSIGVAYTYNEPTVWYEFVYDTAVQVKEHGDRNVLVTNGFISPAALKELSPFIDALNIDLKSFNDDFYRRYCGGNLEAVKKTVEYCAARFHIEITTLIIPTVNDSADEIVLLAEWLAGLNPDIPLHFSRYFPHYQLSLPPTPPATLEQARCLAREKLNYVYIGNVPENDEGSNTYCPRCHNLLIRRRGYRTALVGLNGESCTACGLSISLSGKDPA